MLGQVPAARYILQVERSQAQSRRIQSPLLKILPNSEFISGVDFTVQLGTQQERQIAHQANDQYQVVTAAFPAAAAEIKTTTKLHITEITVEGFSSLVEAESVAETLRQNELSQFEILVIESQVKSSVEKI